MAFLNSHKSFAVKSELDLFASKITQSSIESGYFLEARPVSILDSDSPVEFVIVASDEYVDLSHTQIQLKVKIQSADETEVYKDVDPVAPVNNFMNSLFQHVSIDLNNKTVTPPSNQYAYRSFFEILLNYSSEAKRTHLTSGLYVKDEAGKMEDVKSSGFVERKKFVKNGEIELSGFIHTELTSQDKFMINNVNIRIKFHRNKSNFSLLTTAEDVKSYKIEITEAILLVRKVKVNPSIIVAQNKALLHGNIKYPINRVDVKIISLSSDTTSKMIDNIFIGKKKKKKKKKLACVNIYQIFHLFFSSSGQMPKRIFMGFVLSSAVNGSIHKNPYNFQNFGHTNVLLSSDAHTQIRAIKSNFEKGLI